MRKWLRPDWRARLLDLFACFLIPLYTLLFTHDTRWFTTNFSVIAAARDQRHGFFLWGMLVGVYLLCVLLPVMAALPRPLWPRLCLLGGFLLLLSAVVLPYTPDELPKIADLHVICAFTASCLLVLSLFLLLLQKARQDRQRYWDCMKWLGVRCCSPWCCSRWWGSSAARWRYFSSSPLPCWPGGCGIWSGAVEKIKAFLIRSL